MHPETSHRLKTGCSFASIVWNPYLVKDRKVQKFGCRVCSKNWHTDYQCRLLDGLRSIPSLELRRAMRLSFMYKLIDNNTHIVILPISQRNCPYYTTRSTSSKQLEMIASYIMLFLTILISPKPLLIGITYQHPWYHVIILLVSNVNYSYIFMF